MQAEIKAILTCKHLIFHVANQITRSPRPLTQVFIAGKGCVDQRPAKAVPASVTVSAAEHFLVSSIAALGTFMRLNVKSDYV